MASKLAGMANDEAAVLASVGPRLRALRRQRGTTLAQLAESWVNPLAFLDPNAPLPLPHRAGFWLAVLLWEPQRSISCQHGVSLEMPR